MTSSFAIDRSRLDAALARATAELLATRAPGGQWTGELSASALSTATAVTALAVVQREAPDCDFHSQVRAGLAWLSSHANADGGWGDTTKSLSNLSTTTLGWAAFGAVPGADAEYRVTVERAREWLVRRAGGLDPATLARAVIHRYGKDRTFSVPILTLCALAGRLGSGREAWRHVLPLPFELAACSHRFFAALRLPVVSYALPALIAIGQARHHHRPSGNPLLRALRQATRRPTLRTLAKIQPSNGGFLEATPLTSFVVMSLAGSGQAGHSVTQRGVEFLQKSQRADGSWPIDTNLATWVTTLAVDALEGSAGVPPAQPGEALTGRKDSCGPGAVGTPVLRRTTFSGPVRDWLLAQQYRVEHPYTHAAPGGWAWTDLPGGVPDADDTAGAVVALKHLGPTDDATRAAAFAGMEWLLGVQNRDGGMPTFCRGWGALPFDRSSADITAHAICAWLAWFDDAPPALQQRLLRAWNRALGFLGRVQRPDGAWAPLWFGNEHEPGEENLTYGTSRVLKAIAASLAFHGRYQGKIALTDSMTVAFSKALHAGEWLERAQRADGGWGGGTSSASTVEETALAVEALTWLGDTSTATRQETFLRGVNWLLERVESGTFTEPAPIGFYFAKLWYFERLYPLLFTVAALTRARRVVGQPQIPD